MARLVASLVLVVIAACETACGAGGVTRTVRPPAPANAETRRAPRPREPQPPPLIAPPPAYGNKIVLADAPVAKARRF